MHSRVSLSLLYVNVPGCSSSETKWRKERLQRLLTEEQPISGISGILNSIQRKAVDVPWFLCFEECNT